MLDFADCTIAIAHCYEDQVVWRWDLSSKCWCWDGSRKIWRWKLICICVFVLMYFIRVFVQWEAGVDFEMGAVRVGDGSSFGNCKFAPVPVTSSPSYWTCGKFGANQMQIQNLTETRDISQKKSNSGSPLAPGLNRYSRQRRILELILILSQLLTFLLISSCTEHGSWWSQISLQNVKRLLSACVTIVNCQIQVSEKYSTAMC